MDPNVTLEEIRRLVQLIQQRDVGMPDDHPFTMSDLAVDLANRFSDLDEWLRYDGYLPRPWNKVEY